MLEVLSIPTTARIRGHCYTGGLALASDILVGGVSARLGDTHGQLGLVPIWGVSVRLPERVGRSTAKEAGSGGAKQRCTPTRKGTVTPFA